MKTKLNLTLLATAAMLSSNVAPAQTPLPSPPAALLPIDGVIMQLMTTGTVVGQTPPMHICGGMDDDQLHGNDGDDTLYGGNGADTLYGGNGADTLRSRTATNGITGDGGADSVIAPPVWRGLFSDTLGIVGGDGADFGRDSGGSLTARSVSVTPTLGVPVNKGFTTDPLSIIVGGGDADFVVGAPAPATNARTAQPGDALSVYTSIQSPYTLVPGPVVNRGLESDPMGINGDEGADVSAATAAARTANLSVGGVGTGSFTCDPLDEDSLFQLFTGLWGGGGTDERDEKPSQPVTK